jgi:hypothetical protein
MRSIATESRSGPILRHDEDPVLGKLGDDRVRNFVQLRSELSNFNSHSPLVPDGVHAVRTA